LGSIPIEIHILRSLSHPNMIKFLDYYADRYFFYLVTELHGPASSVGFATTDGGHRNASSQFQFHAGEWDDADDKLPPPVPALKTSRDLYECMCLERHGPFSEERARKVFRQIIDCVLYLHSHDICHRDLKDENITIDEQLSIKLIDFGSAAFTHQPLSGFHGTEAYCPPEAINSHNSSSSSTYDGKKADVWTLGILLHIMLTRNTPFNSFWEVLNRRWDLNSNIRTSSSSPNIQIPTGVRDLLNLMLQKDPNKRCDLETVWNHPW
ncbi:kinase-like domain-containing protein, partial [Paraphysoderma sedebokerense]